MILAESSFWLIFCVAFSNKKKRNFGEKNDIIPKSVRNL